MLFGDDEANKFGREAFALASDFFAARGFHGLASSNLTQNAGAIEARLAEICHAYRTRRSLSPLAIENRVVAARTAQHSLEIALSELRGLPRSFIFEFYRSRKLPATHFDELLDQLDSIRGAAVLFDRELKRGAKSDEAVKNAAHGIANLFSQLTEKAFPKTLKVHETEDEFLHDGPELVRILLKTMDPKITRSAVSTALKSFSSKKNLDRN